MKYLELLDEIDSEVLRRKDFLGAILKVNPNYNTGSINRHFSKLLSSGIIESVGEDLYIQVTPVTARYHYTYMTPSLEFSEIEILLSTEFPLVDFIILETIQLNEFLNHQISMNTIIVMVERLLMDAVFERLNGKFPSILFAPKPEEYQRYGSNGTIIVDKLCSRYPKNLKQKHRYSIEKLIVDLFAEKVIKMMVSIGDYPEALDVAFKRYVVNETRLFNYAKSRYVETEIRMMIRNQTSIRLFTEEGIRRNVK